MSGLETAKSVNDWMTDGIASSQASAQALYRKGMQHLKMPDRQGNPAPLSVNGLSWAARRVNQVQINPLSNFAQIKWNSA
jgi:hypothetical protein